MINYAVSENTKTASRALVQKANKLGRLSRKSGY